MTDDEIDGIITWVIERGLVGASEIELLHGFCERSVAAGLALKEIVLPLIRIGGGNADNSLAETAVIPVPRRNKRPNEFLKILIEFDT